jgi:hypothetical protein
MLSDVGGFSGNGAEGLYGPLAVEVWVGVVG